MDSALVKQFGGREESGRVKCECDSGPLFWLRGGGIFADEFFAIWNFCCEFAGLLITC